VQRERGEMSSMTIPKTAPPAITQSPLRAATEMVGSDGGDAGELLVNLG